MKKSQLLLLPLLILLLGTSLVGSAQTVTAAATVTDSDAQTWNNGTYKIQFYPNPSYPNPASYSINGVPLSTYGTLFQGVMNGSGAFSTTVGNTALITPSGSAYTITLCPNATVQCSVLSPIALTGQSLSSYISANIKAVRFPATGANSYGYSDTEVSPIPVQGAFYFNVSSLISRQWTGTAWQDFGGGGSSGFPITLGSTSVAANSTTTAINGLTVNGVTLQSGGSSTNFLNEAGAYVAVSVSCGGCVVEAPTVTQTVVQPAGTDFDVNTFLGKHWVDPILYPSNNGIATVAASTPCSTFTPSGNSGCSIAVSPAYGNSESPAGWASPEFSSGGNIRGTVLQPGGAGYDYRNGGSFEIHRDPFSPAPVSADGHSTTVFEDLNMYTMQTLFSNEGTPAATSAQLNVYAGGQNFQNYFNSIPEYTFGPFYYGTNNVLEDWSSGRLFGQHQYVLQHGVGDAMLRNATLQCDGGLNTSDDEGCEGEDEYVQENPSVAQGLLSSGGGGTGATTLVVDFNAVGEGIGAGSQGQDRLAVDIAQVGFSGSHWTGGGPSANSFPSFIADSTQTFPVSTIFSVCYAGSDNGVGGASGCTPGSVPSGYIPPINTSPTMISPATSITVGVDASYTGLPAGFCTSSNLQSSNSGAACYLPTSGTVCLTSPEEYETVAYTYNSGTQQLTLANLRFPHSNNGLMLAHGGLCDNAVEDLSNRYTGGGTQGFQDPVYPIEGSIDSHTFYYITQRVNEGYGQPLLGGSSDGGSTNGGSAIQGTSGEYGALCFNTGISGISLNGLVVTFSMAAPAGTEAPFTNYNQLKVAINTSNSTYNGNYNLTWLGSNQFTYTLASTPTGGTPSTGTSAYCNAGYNIYPSARILNVVNSSNGTIDGTLNLMPNSMQHVQNGDLIRVPHYQQMSVQGNHLYIAKFNPEQYVGQHDSDHIWTGNITGPEPGNWVVNQSGIGYLGYGGTYSLPRQARETSGLWSYDLFMDLAPDSGITHISGCKPFTGNPALDCYNPASNFNLFELPVAPGGVAGINSLNVLNFDTNVDPATIANGTQSGIYSFANEGGRTQNTAPTTSVAEVRAGYFSSYFNIKTPTVTTNNVNVQALSNPAIIASVIGTPGSTTYNYWVVGNAIAGSTAQTVPEEVSVNTGNATLSGTNYVLICMPYQGGFATYDVLKTNTSTSLLLALSATAPNGLSFPATPGNYSCVADTGQSTGSYSPPSVNTTGQVSANAINSVAPFEANGTPGFTGTATISACTLTIKNGIITGTSGC